MEPYKANRNQTSTNNSQANNDNSEVEEKSEEQRNVDNNAKNIQNLAEVAIASKNPYAMAAGGAVKLADKVTGGQASQKLGQAVNKVTKTMPQGKKIQDVSNRAAESGLSDAVGQGASMMGGGATKGVSEATKAMPTKSSTPSTSPSTSNNSSTPASKSSGGSSSLFGGSSSPFSGNILGALSFKKKLIIAGIIGIGFSFLMFITIFAQQDNKNLALTNSTTLSSKSTRNLTPAEIENKITYVGDSRIVGMQSSLSNQNINYISSNDANYEWFINTAIPEIETKLNSDPSSILVLTPNLKDLNNIDSYISSFQSLISKYPNANIFIMSVNPIDENLAKNNGINITNSEIEQANNKLSQAFSDKYINSYNGLTNISTQDGVLYDQNTNNELNNYVTSTLSSKGISGFYGGDLGAKLKDLADYYINSVKTYLGNNDNKNRVYYKLTFGTRSFGDDCTEFAAAFMTYVSGIDIPESYSSEMVYPNDTWAQTVASYGWKAYSSDQIGSASNLKTGDILIAHIGALYSTKGKHAEIYISPTETFGWGTVKTSYPTQQSIRSSNDGLHTHFYDNNGFDYITIYRYEG